MQAYNRMFLRARNAKSNTEALWMLLERAWRWKGEVPGLSSHVCRCDSYRDEVDFEHLAGPANQLDPHNLYFRGCMGARFSAAALAYDLDLFKPQRGRLLYLKCALLLRFLDRATPC